MSSNAFVIVQCRLKLLNEGHHNYQQAGQSPENVDHLVSHKTIHVVWYYLPEWGLGTPRSRRERSSTFEDTMVPERSAVFYRGTIGNFSRVRLINRIHDAIPLVSSSGKALLLHRSVKQSHTHKSRVSLGRELLNLRNWNVGR